MLHSTLQDQVPAARKALEARLHIDLATMSDESVLANAAVHGIIDDWFTFAAAVSDI